MAEPNSDLLFFKGTSPEECEVFVATIRRRAFDQGKYHDNEWVANLASTYLVGDALYWYEELDGDVQNDWRRLRPALLARFGRRNTISTMASSTRHSVRKGCLKVLDSNGTVQSYISISSSKVGAYDKLCTSPKDALKISFTVSSVGDEPFEIEIIAPQLPQGGDKLAITWPRLVDTQWMNDPDYHAICCSLSTNSSIRPHWDMERRVWKISEDGVLHIEYPKPAGSFETLRSSFYSSGNYIWWVKSSKTGASAYVPVSVVVEDAI